MSFIDDYLRWLNQHEDMIRRLTEDPLRDYESVSARLHKFSALDQGALEAAARSLDTEILACRLKSATSFTEEALTRLAAAGAIGEMERYEGHSHTKALTARDVIVNGLRKQLLREQVLGGMNGLLR